jgi:hypothetical protein
MKLNTCFNVAQEVWKKTEYLLGFHLWYGSDSCNVTWGSMLADLQRRRRRDERFGYYQHWRGKHQLVLNLSNIQLLSRFYLDAAAT